MANINDWGEWKKTLGKAVNLGEVVGMSDEHITNLAEKIGSFLANNFDPRNDEERLLKEMWDAGDTKDREVLAKLIVRIADN